MWDKYDTEVSMHDEAEGDTRVKETLKGLNTGVTRELISVRHQPIDNIQPNKNRRTSSSHHGDNSHSGGNRGESLSVHEGRVR